MAKTSDTVAGLILAGILIGGAWLFGQARALGNITVVPGRVTGMQFVGVTPVMELTVIAQNTASTDLLINSFSGNVYANDVWVGNASFFAPVSIPGNMQTEFPIQIQFQLLGIVNEIIQAFQTKNFTQKIDIRGHANVASFQLPFNLAFHVGS